MKKPKYTYSHCVIKAKDRYDLCRKINRRLKRGERVLFYQSFGSGTSSSRFSEIRYTYDVTIESLED